MPRQTRKSAPAQSPSSKTGSAAAHPAPPHSAHLSGRAIVTIIGSDRVGIIAGIANAIAEANVNILDISQSVIREFFTMIMMVDLAGAAISFHTLSDRLAQKGQELSV